MIIQYYLIKDFLSKSFFNHQRTNSINLDARIDFVVEEGELVIVQNIHFSTPIRPEYPVVVLHFE
jgi:hypothetical protein